MKQAYRNNLTKWDSDDIVDNADLSRETFAICLAVWVVSWVVAESIPVFNNLLGLICAIRKLVQLRTACSILAAHELEPILPDCHQDVSDSVQHPCLGYRLRYFQLSSISFLFLHSLSLSVADFILCVVWFGSVHVWSHD